jgi:DNA-binding PadR family transcriptional regulator
MYERVLQVLSLTIWKRSIQIEDEVIEINKGKLPFGSVYVTLDTLVERGLVEKREAQLTEAELRTRRAFEYRLTQEGLRRKNQEQEREDDACDLLPHIA